MNEAYCPECGWQPAIKGICVSCNSKSRYAYQLSDAELEEVGKRPINPGPIGPELYTELSKIDLLALAREELSGKLAGDLDKPMATFLHMMSAYVKNSGRNMILTGEAGIGKDATVAAVASLFPKEIVISERRISPRTLDYKWRDHENEWLTGKILLLEDVESKLLDNSASLKTFSSAPTDKAHNVSIVDRGRVLKLRCLGRPCITMTTASAAAGNEFLTRFDSLEILSSPKRLLEIAIFQGKKAAGLIKHEDSKVQLYLKSFAQVEVSIPFAELVSTRWPVTPRLTRELPRFLEFVAAAAAANQYRRRNDEQGRIIATADDYQTALDAAAQFTEGQLSGLTGPMLETYRATEEACRRTESNPAQTWQEFTEAEYVAGQSVLKTRRKPAPDESLRGWACTNDILGERKVRADMVYEHLATLRERGAVTAKMVSGVLGSDRPVWFYQVHQLDRRNLPTRQEIERISGISGNSTLYAIAQAPKKPDDVQYASSPELPQLPEVLPSVTVRFVTNVAEFVSVDYRLNQIGKEGKPPEPARFGPFRPGATCTLPEPDAAFMIEHGFAVKVNN